MRTASSGNWRQGAVTEPRGGRRRTTSAYGWVAGANPQGEDPGRGSGVKQTRKIGRGANRRGRAKRRGRNGVGRDARGWWTLLIGAAKWTKTPWKALAAGMQRAGSARGLRGGAKRTRGSTRELKGLRDGGTGNTAKATRKRQRHGGIRRTQIRLVPDSHSIL